MSSGSPDSSQQHLDYDYPKIRVNRSLTNSDLNTLIMRSNPRRQPEEASNSLADSSYEVLSRSMCETSDDEGHTESLASTNGDGNTPDDLSSLCDDDEFEDDDDDYIDDGSQHLPPPLADSTNDPDASQYTTEPDDSMMTSRAGMHQDEASYQKLEEIPSTDDDRVIVRGAVAEFKSNAGLPEVLQDYGCEQLRLSVQMALSRHSLPISRSFRILYVGVFPGWAVFDVNNHIGAALHATPSSSRFNILQGSDRPGSTSSSRVQLEPAGPELVVDHCPVPRIVHQSSGIPQVVVTMNDGSQLSIASGKVIRNNRDPLPDLIIFGYANKQPESESVEEAEVFRTARDALKNTHIPSIDIAVVRPYGGETFSFNEHCMQLCIEGRPQRGHAYQTLKTMPIDLYAFLSIDPFHLNRHLAYLRDQAHTTNLNHWKNNRDWTIRSLLPWSVHNPTSSHPGELWARRHTWASLLAFTVMVVAYIAQSSLSPGALEQFPVVGVESTAVSEPYSLCTSGVSSVTTTTSSSSLVVVPTITKSLSTPRDLTVIPSEEKPSSEHTERVIPPREDQRGSFEVEVTGDHQFILRPSKQLTNGRRKLFVSVQVNQGPEDVPIRLSRASDNTYTVVLEQEYPEGTFNVSVVAQRKPILRQVFEVKLGSSKSTYSYLMDNVGRLSQIVKQDMAIVQNNWKNLSTQISQELQGGAVAVFGQTRYWNQKLRDSTQTVAEHLQGAKREATRQLSTGSKITQDVSRVLQESWQVGASRAAEVAQSVSAGAWQRTRPLRTSQRLLLARKRALRLRCKLEKKLGVDNPEICQHLSGTEKKQQQRGHKCGKKRRRSCILK
jgi:hypothetical protein